MGTYGSLTAGILSHDHRSLAKAISLAEREDSAAERLLVLGGVVGYRIPTLRSRVAPVSHGDYLILATDGIHVDFAERLPFGLNPQALADHISAHHFKGTDDSLVLVVRYVGRTHAPDSF